MKYIFYSILDFVYFRTFDISFLLFRDNFNFDHWNIIFFLLSFDDVL